MPEQTSASTAKSKDGGAQLDVKGSSRGVVTVPVHVLSNLLRMQDVEDHKPKLSKISWLPDIMVYRASIIPTVLTPVLVITLWSSMVAAVSVYWGKQVGLRNDIVPLLSVVVGLLLVFRNTSAYERYASGRKDFTSLISNVRNFSRLVWVITTLPPSTDTSPGPMTRDHLTQEKRKLIRLAVAFVIATKHHLRAEGGVHHDDLRGLLPHHIRFDTLRSLAKSDAQSPGLCASPQMLSPVGLPRSPLDNPGDEEAAVGLPPPQTALSHRTSIGSTLRSISSQQSQEGVSGGKAKVCPSLSNVKRRPTAVRVVIPEADNEDATSTTPSASGAGEMRQVDNHFSATERTPLIKPGVTPDLRKTLSDTKPSSQSFMRSKVQLGKMVELGLPLIIANEMSRMIFRFRRMGCLESVGPAGVNTLQTLVQSMTDQLGSMERIVQTPMPYIVAVHMKQATTMLLLLLPFVLVDTLKLKMIPIMFCIALIYMGIEGIAAQVEQPFGTDPCDLNLDLFCTELVCECEALLERLPEGDADEGFEFDPDLLDQDLAHNDDGGD